MNQRGFSQVEMLIALAIVSIFFLAAISSFFGISKGLFVSKSRSLATQLAQEKIESMKNITYSRLVVTTDEDYTAYGYDNTYYPPETMTVGDITFIRRVVVRRVQETGNDLVEAGASSPDTGLKKIKVIAIWREGIQEKSLDLTNILEDSNRLSLNGTVTGIVTDATSGNAIAQVHMTISQNVNWDAYTTTTGSYTIKCATGSYRVTASKSGYWDATSAILTIGTGSSVTQNFSLTPKATGSITGYVYKNENLIISMVCAGTTDQSYEYVELYNPTTFTITISPTNFMLKAVDESNNVTTPALTWLTSNPIAISSCSHLLLASTNPITGYYVNPASGGTFYMIPDILYTPDSITSQKGGIAITDGYGVAIDSMGWAASGHAAPTKGRETTGVTCGSQGLDVGHCILRSIYYDESAKYLNGTDSNAMDTDNNSIDCWYRTYAYRLPRKTTSASLVPLSGKPAVGAIITADDGLSAGVIAAASGSYGASKFTLVGVATGTWIVYATSGTSYNERPGNTVTSGGTADAGRINLSTTTSEGFISGQVRYNSSGLSGIYVQAGTIQTTTNSQGRYYLRLSPGDYTVVANPDNINVNYVSQSTTYTVTVNTGQIASGIDFDLSAGGIISGTVKNSNNDAVPDITVRAVDKNGTGVERASAISGSDGTYTLANLPSGNDYNNYIVNVVIDSWETTTPSTYTVTVAQGTTSSGKDFTLSSAYGKISGNVLDATSQPIKTGILIIATTSTISSEPLSSNPPAFNSSLRSGGILYYGTTSSSDGTYELSVRGGYTYSVYAWYTTVSAGRSTTTRKSCTVGVTSGQTSTKNYPDNFTGN